MRAFQGIPFKNVDYACQLRRGGLFFKNLTKMYGFDTLTFVRQLKVCNKTTSCRLTVRLMTFRIGIKIEKVIVNKLNKRFHFQKRLPHITSQIKNNFWPCLMILIYFMTSYYFEKITSLYFKNFQLWSEKVISGINGNIFWC